MTEPNAPITWTDGFGVERKLQMEGESNTDSSNYYHTYVPMDIDNLNTDVFKVNIGGEEHTITTELNGCPLIELHI